MDKDSPPSSYGSVSSSFGGGIQPTGEPLSAPVVVAPIETVAEAVEQSVGVTEEETSDEKSGSELKRRSSARLSVKSRDRLNASSLEKTEVSSSTISSELSGKSDSTLTDITFETFSQSRIEEVTVVEKPVTEKKIVIKRLKNNKNLFNAYMSKRQLNANKPSTNLVQQQNSVGGVRINKNLKVNFKNKSQQNSRITRSTFTIATGPTFKEKLDQSRRVMKYKRLIRNLKKDVKNNDLRFKNADKLSKIRDLQSDVVEEAPKKESTEETKDPVSEIELKPDEANKLG